MFYPWSRPCQLKMDSLHTCLLVLGLVCVLSVQTGYGELLCHKCNSAPEYDGKECDDPYLSGDKFLTNCTDDGIAEGVTYKYCRKLVQDVMGEFRVIRQCGITGRDNQCVDRTGTKAIKITYCECNESRCNSANSFGISMLLVTISSALLAFICHS